MKQKDDKEKLIDYLYGELDPYEKKAFQTQLQADPELRQEFESLNHLRNLYQKELPQVHVPQSITKNLYHRLGIRRPWYEVLKHEIMLRSVLAGAFALVLTLGLTFGYKQWRDHTAQVAQNTNLSKSSQKTVGEELNFSDLVVTGQPLRAQHPMQAWRSQPSIGNGLVTLASYGSPSIPQPYYDEPRGYDIQNLDQEAEHSVAQFAHQQALRLRVMGDYKGAAEALARVIKTYPNYPRKFEVFAERIDCLFRSRQASLARKELSWLRGLSPELASLVEQRWRE